MKHIVKLLATVALMFVGATTYAQSPSPFHVGIKAGANFTNISSDIKDYSSKTATGYGIGAMARLDIKKTYLQAELFFSEKNSKFEGDQGTIDAKMKQIEIPVVIGHKILDLPLFSLRGFAGG
ncbi:MAG: outer membrane beta-barrel protein, partial [Flavobacterium sp.]